MGPAWRERARTGYRGGGALFLALLVAVGFEL